MTINIDVRPLLPDINGRDKTEFAVQVVESGMGARNIVVVGPDPDGDDWFVYAEGEVNVFEVGQKVLDEIKELAETIADIAAHAYHQRDGAEKEPFKERFDPKADHPRDEEGKLT
jgi:hypothetical protein